MIESIDIERCTGCGICDAVCPADVIHMEAAPVAPEIAGLTRTKLLPVGSEFQVNSNIFPTPSTDGTLNSQDFPSMKLKDSFYSWSNNSSTSSSRRSGTCITPRSPRRCRAICARSAPSS